jgi:predicted RNase H-like nuclease (RuvC/YqgF family)
MSDSANDDEYSSSARRQMRRDVQAEAGRGRLRALEEDLERMRDERPELRSRIDGLRLERSHLRAQLRERGLDVSSDPSIF